MELLLGIIIVAAVIYFGYKQYTKGVTVDNGVVLAEQAPYKMEPPILEPVAEPPVAPKVQDAPKVQSVPAIKPAAKKVAAKKPAAKKPAAKKPAAKKTAAKKK